MELHRDAENAQVCGENAFAKNTPDFCKTPLIPARATRVHSAVPIRLARILYGIKTVLLLLTYSSWLNSCMWSRRESAATGARQHYPSAIATGGHLPVYDRGVVAAIASPPAGCAKEARRLDPYRATGHDLHTAVLHALHAVCPTAEAPASAVLAKLRVVLK